VDPVFPTEGHWPDSVLGGVRAQLQDRIIQEASQSIPQRQSVVAGFGQSALRESLATSGLDLALDRFQNRSRLLLAQLVTPTQAEILLSSLCINGEEFISESSSAPVMDCSFCMARLTDRLYITLQHIRPAARFIDFGA
jgi:hypothetical protein